MPLSSSSNRFDRVVSRRQLLLASLGAGVAAATIRDRSLLFGCRNAASEPDRQEVLRQTVRVVMLPTFVDLADKAASLSSAAGELRDAPSAETASKVRRIWRDARSVWKRSEAFLMGPSDDLAVTGGAIDSWPAAGDKIEQLVAGAEALDEAKVSTLAANLRGFPGIEHLVFDAAAGEAVADRRLLSDPAAARRRELVASECADLAKKCKALSDAWAGPQGYGHELAEAGGESKTFRLQRDAIDKIVTAVLALAELVQMAKLAKPLGIDTGGAPRPDLEEAVRSDFSLTSIEQNLVGLKSLYECRLGDNAGESLSNEVRKVSPKGDDSFRLALDGALASVRGITMPMRALLAADRAPLTRLHEAVRLVKRSISTDVASALGASLGFGYSDTD